MSWFTLLLSHDNSTSDDPIVKAFGSTFRHDKPDKLESTACNAVDSCQEEVISAADTVEKFEPPAEPKRRMLLECGRKLEASDVQSCAETAEAETAEADDSVGFLLFTSFAVDEIDDEKDHAAELFSGLNSTFRHNVTEEPQTTTTVWCPVRGTMKYSLQAAKEIKEIPLNVSLSAPRDIARSHGFRRRDNAIDFVKESVLQRCAKQDQQWRAAHAERRAVAATKDVRLQQSLTRSGQAFEEEHTAMMEARKAMASTTVELERRLAESERRAKEARQQMARVVPGMQMYLAEP